VISESSCAAGFKGPTSEERGRERREGGEATTWSIKLHTVKDEVRLGS